MMKLWSNSFQDGGTIAGKYAFCVIDPATHVRLSTNLNPHLAWSELPAGTRSLALICHDPDVPSSGENVNQEGKTVPADLPRVDFFHWSLVDLAPELVKIEEGEFSDGVTPHGKSGPVAVCGAKNGEVREVRQGVNDYSGWFAGDPQMAGDYYGYDGPCPPWNDMLIHHYVFTLYALDIERLPLEGRFTGTQALAAIQGHILDQASIMAAYSLNPALEPMLVKG
jgi:Raf kinase inhibitor-like YbhB/YbcL family protein